MAPVSIEQRTLPPPFQQGVTRDQAIILEDPDFVGEAVNFDHPAPGCVGDRVIVAAERHVFADGGYAGDKLKDALRQIGKWTIEIVKRSDAANGFVVLPRRWVVERTLAWLNRNRRLAKDFEQTIASATAWLFIASIQLFARRLASL